MRLHKRLEMSIGERKRTNDVAEGKKTKIRPDFEWESIEHGCLFGLNVERLYAAFVLVLLVLQHCLLVASRWEARVKQALLNQMSMKVSSLTLVKM